MPVHGFQRPERIHPFGGNGETPDVFFGEAQNASGSQAEIRTLPDVFFTDKQMHRGMNRIIKPNAFQICDLLAFKV